MPKLHIKAFAANTSSGDSAFSWDTDGIPFVVDNYATEIMCDERKLFTGPLTPMSVTLATDEGLITTIKLVVALRLVLTDSSNKHHTYSIPICVYDYKIPLNILGVPALGAYFDNGADIRSPLEEDGTKIQSVSTKPRFVWDHGKYERHFIHFIAGF